MQITDVPSDPSRPGPPSGDTPADPVPGSSLERRRFAELQRRLPALFERVFFDRHAPQTIVVVPSMSLDREELRKLTGASHYEERLLCLLMLLRFPRAHLVYVTSEALAPSIVDYYLHLLPGVPPSHARRRLTLLSCDDGSSVPLTQKILGRPSLVDRLRSMLPDPWSAHLTCFNVTPLERTLAVRLGVPLYGCDPELARFGTKSGSRETFRRAGVPLPDGHERLRDAHDVEGALVDLKRRHPRLGRAVVKLDEGFSGEGNGVFSFADAPDNAGVASGDGDLAQWVRRTLPARLRFEATGESWERYEAKFARMGGVVECFVEGTDVRSPSVQCRIDPLRRSSIIATHDQILGGPSGQVYEGCTFPAHAEYCHDLHEHGLRVATLLAQEGVLARFSVDFVTVRREATWETTAIEINLRKGGTTHPFLMLQFLTDGAYNPDTGLYRTPGGQACYYRATDNLCDSAYRGLTPDDLIDIAVNNDLHFDAATQEGVMFHLVGALETYGKLGAMCIGRSPAIAEQYFQETVAVLDRETSDSSRRPAPVRAD